MTDWTGERYEPMSIRELTTRETPSLPQRSISDTKREGDWLAGMLWGACFTLMAAFLIGAAVLLWLTVHA